MDCGDEPVAPPFDVDDEPIPILAVTQRATQSSHLSREVGGGDKMSRPNASSQVLLADKLASPFNQSNQDLQSTAPERHGLVTLQKKELRRKQAERSERNSGWRGAGRSSSFLED